MLFSYTQVVGRGGGIEGPNSPQKTPLVTIDINWKCETNVMKNKMLKQVVDFENIKLLKNR